MLSGTSNVMTPDFTSRRNPVKQYCPSLNQDEKEDEQKDNTIGVILGTQSFEPIYCHFDIVVYFVTLNLQSKVLQCWHPFRIRYPPQMGKETPPAQYKCIK